MTALPADGSGKGWRFSWDIRPSVAVSEWWLVLGTEPGARDLFDSGSLGRRRSLLVDALTRDGGTVYARLWYRRGNVWLFEDFGYPLYRTP